MIILGITGGIGSGKSYVSHLLASRFGIPVYDCDREAKRLNNESPAIRRQLIELVGPKVFNEYGLVKPILAKYLFADAQHAARVNAIIHPVVYADFTAWCKRQQGPVLGVESAILYESGFNRVVDKVLFVDAPLEVRITRAMKRDGAERSQVEARMAQQRVLESRSLADFVVLNDGVSDSDLLDQLSHIINKVNLLTDSN